MFAPTHNSRQLWRMCGRYRRTTQEEELPRLYHIPIPKQTDADQLQHRAEPEGPDHSLRPQTQLRSLDALQWGLIPYWAKDPKVGLPAEGCALWPATPRLWSAGPTEKSKGDKPWGGQAAEPRVAMAEGLRQTPIEHGHPNLERAVHAAPASTHLPTACHATRAT